MKNFLRTLALSVVLMLLAATVGYGLEFELIEVAGEGAVPMTPEQWDAIQRATQTWEGYFADPVTITIDVAFADFPALLFDDALGLTKVQVTTHPYNTVREAMLLDARATREDHAVDALPADSLPVTDVNGSRSDDMITMATANAKALGLGTALDPLYGEELANSADALISFNTSYAEDFDYDPRDGIGAGKLDFVGIVTHEIAHALGFSSMTDVQDANSDFTLHPSTLDLWRFAETGGPHDLATEARRITAGAAEYYDSVLNNVPMSHGMSESEPPDPDAETPTGYAQASHWSDHLGYLMDPSLAREVQASVHVDDQHALNYIGYSPVLNLRRFPRDFMMGFFRRRPDLPLPAFGGAFDQFAAPPDPDKVKPPFDPDFAVRIGLDFGPGLDNRGGMGFIQFEDQQQYDGKTVRGLSYDLFSQDFNENPPRDPMTTIPPTILDFYFESDSNGVPFSARMLGGEHGVQYDSTLGPFGGYRIPLALDGFGDNVRGDIDAIATLIMFADQWKVPDPWTENLFRLGPMTPDNSLIVYDAQALGIPEPSTIALSAIAALVLLARLRHRARKAWSNRGIAAPWIKTHAHMSRAA